MNLVLSFENSVAFSFTVYYATQQETVMKTQIKPLGAASTEVRTTAPAAFSRRLPVTSFMFKPRNNLKNLNYILTNCYVYH